MTFSFLDLSNISCNFNYVISLLLSYHPSVHPSIIPSRLLNRLLCSLYLCNLYSVIHPSTHLSIHPLIHPSRNKSTLLDRKDRLSKDQKSIHFIVEEIEVQWLEFSCSEPFSSWLKFHSGPYLSSP